MKYESDLDMLVNDLKVKSKGGVPVNKIYEQGITMLMYYSHEGNYEEVNTYLKAGADVNIQATNGISALMAAAYAGHLNIVKLLLDYGASIYQVDKAGAHPLNFAFNQKHYDVVCVLLHAGSFSNELQLFNHVKYVNNDVAKCILANGNIVKFHMSFLYPYLGKTLSGYAESIYGVFSGENTIYEGVLDEVEIYRKDPVKYILENHDNSQYALKSLINLENQNYSTAFLETVKECLRREDLDGDLASICGEDSLHYDL